MLQFLMDVLRDLLLLAMLCAVSTASMPYPVDSGSLNTSTQSLDFSLTRSQSVERDASPNSTRPGQQDSSLASPQSVVQGTTLTSAQNVEQDSSLTSAQNVNQDSSLASPPHMERVTFFTGTQTLEKDSSYTSMSFIEQDSSLSSAQSAEKDSFLASPQSLLTSTKYAEKEDSSLPSVPRVAPGHHPRECHSLINILDTLLELRRVDEEEVVLAEEQHTSTDKILGIDAIYRRLIRLLLQLIHDNLTEEEIRAICLCLCSMIPCPPECNGIEPPWGPVNLGG